METNMYKELSYRIKGFRALSCLVAMVTVILCLLVGIGCWVLIAGVRENEHVLKEAESVQEKLEVEIVEGNIQEPLQLTKKESLNKVGRVVQHIAEIDFAQGTSAAAKDDPISASVPAATFVQEFVVPEPVQEFEQLPYEEPRDFRIIQEELGQPIEIDGVIGVRLQPPSVDGTSTNFMSRVGGVSPNNGRYVKNELSVVEVPASVYSASYQEPVRTQSPALHRAILDTLVNFTSELSDDIANQGLFDALIDRTSEKYMRDTIQWIGDYTSQMMTNGDQEFFEAPRSKRSAAAPLNFMGRALAYINYAAFGKFMVNEVDAIAEYNMEARKLSGDPTADFLDSSFWSAATASPVAASGGPVLTAATDDWEPQVNKISLEFIGEILNTLLNMMREFLMKDHVMECLWFMFCEDLNHQAKYADVYGLMARVNSVGLKVLTEREDRQLDTIGEVWRSLTAWETLQCEYMFPKCDGPKALEIVNEVALGSRRK